MTAPARQAATLEALRSGVFPSNGSAKKKENSARKTVRKMKYVVLVTCMMIVNYPCQLIEYRFPDPIRELCQASFCR